MDCGKLTAFVVIIASAVTIAADGQLETSSHQEGTKITVQTYFACFISGIVFCLVTMNWLGLVPWEKVLPSSRTFTKTRAFVEQPLSTSVFPNIINNEEMKMILVVRNDLKMGKGKQCAQCGHAVLGAYRHAVKRNEKHLGQWLSEGQRKVVLKSDTVDSLLELKNTAENKGLNTYIVCDAGRTQIASGSLTVLAIGPAPESVVDAITGHLKLL